MTPSSASSPGGERLPTSSSSALDPVAIAAAARQRDPGLPPETAELLARQAGDLLQAGQGMDAPALARELLAANMDVGATAANMVATAAVSVAARSAEQ